MLPPLLLLAEKFCFLKVFLLFFCRFCFLDFFLLFRCFPLFDQVNALYADDEEKENEDDDEDNYLTQSEIVSSNQLWMLLLSLTPSPNFKKLLCFLFSSPCSNAYVESVFSQMKHLVNDKRNCMTTKLVTVELKIRLNATLKCTDMYKYILSNPTGNKKGVMRN